MCNSCGVGIANYRNVPHICAAVDKNIQALSNKNLSEKVAVSRAIYSKLLIKIVNRQEMSKKKIDRYLSKNPNINIDDVLRNPQIKWNYRDLSMNPSVTLDFVLANPQLNWCYCMISMNPNITMADVLAHPEMEWCGVALSANPNITVREIEANPQILWDMDYLAINRNITPQTIIHGQVIKSIYLFCNENFTIHKAAIPNYIDLNYVLGHNFRCCNFVSKNPNITIDDILKYSGWDFHEISRGANITMQNVLKNRHISWDMDAVYANPNIIMRDIISHKKANAAGVARNPNLTPAIIQSYKIKSPGVLRNAFIWHNDKVFERISEQIKSKKKETIDMLSRFLCRSTAESITFYIDPLY